MVQNGTIKFHVNKLSHDPGPKLANPRVERKSQRKNAFVGSPLCGAKNLRFRHGRKKNLNKNLTFPFLRFIVRIFEVYISKIFHAPEKLFKAFGPFVGSMFVSQAYNIPKHFVLKRFVSRATTLVGQNGTIKFHVNKLPHHRGPKLPNPRVERKSQRKNAFVGVPLCGAKKPKISTWFQKEFE